MDVESLPHILVIDDLYGRTVAAGGNEERRDFCRRLRLVDITGDQPSSVAVPAFPNPVAVAVFTRGQEPKDAARGALVQNDLSQVIEKVRAGERRHPNQPWSLILLDLLFLTGRVTEASELKGARGIPEGISMDREQFFGLEVLSELNRNFPELPVAILSTEQRSKISREWVGRGAVGFLAKSEESPASALRTLLRQQGLLPDPSGRIAGHSTELLLALREARRAAAHDRPVLILGERGTGKELLAKYVREHRDPHKPFVPINCGQFSDSADNAFSALFGHKRGSFTGALSDRPGLVLNAKGGILFLDEVSSLPLTVQQGLQRLLQEKEIAPFGAQERPIKVADVKVLAASNLDLDDLVRKGRFMPDLLDRLKGGTLVRLPPLRNRLSDLPVLVELFVRQEETALGPAARRREWDNSVYEHLKGSRWPGNVRELETCLKQAVSNNPDLEILHPRYIRLPLDEAEEPREPSPASGDLQRRGARGSPFDVLASVDFRDATLQELNGKLADVLRVLSAYIEAVIRSTATPSTEAPDGKINLSGASRILTGNGNLKTSQPADFMKGLLKILQRQNLLTPILLSAYERAEEVRKGRTGKEKDE